MVSSRRWRRKFVIPLAVISILFIFITSPFGIALANWGLTSSLPPDSGEPVDEIVVLGRGEGLRNRRVELLEGLWKVKRSPRMFISGMLDAQPMVEQLEQNGVTRQSLDGESCSRTTQENAQFSAAILRPQGVQKILLVTDPPHMLRSLLLFRSFGFTVLPYMSPLPPQLGIRDQIFILAREYIGLAYYSMTGRFNQKIDYREKSPPDDVLKKITAWNCRIQKVSEKGKV